jgi:hypothetical protein
LGDCELVPKGADEYAHECAKKEAANSAEYYAEKEANSAEYYAKKEANSAGEEVGEEVGEE